MVAVIVCFYLILSPGCGAKRSGEITSGNRSWKNNDQPKVRWEDEQARFFCLQYDGRTASGNTVQRTSEDDAAQLQYLKNYIEDYRLGPEDVITVEVFGPQVQIYSQQNITVPPDGKVNYKLIGQINVRGRTVQDVEKEITEKLNEYIIDPKVTVQLVQSHSMKYIVDGDVGRPSVYEMTRRMTVREAIVNAGGILPTGDKSKVQIARAGLMTPIAVNFKDLEKGKGLDEAIAPGDMIFVPGNRFKSIQKWMQIVQGFTTLPMILIRR